MRIWWRLPVFAAAVAYVLLGRHPVIGGAVVFTMFVPSRIVPPKNLDLFLASAAAALAAFFGAIVASKTRVVPNLIGGTAPGALHEAIALAALAAVAARVPWTAPRGGRHVDVALSLGVTMALGAARPQALYPALVVVYLVVAFVALRALDPVRRTHSARTILWAVATVVIGAAVTYALSLALPPLHDRAQTMAIEQFGGGDTSRSGFSDAVRLGGLREIVGSDAIALRVRGRHVDRLRGVVYTRYGHGRWFARIGERGRPVAPASRSGQVTIEHVGAPRDRWFVPLGAQAITFDPADARVDATGVFRGDDATVVRFDPGPPRTTAPPDEDDRSVPTDLAEPIAAIARRWTSTTAETKLQLAAIERRLGAFDYSLELPSVTGDPVLAFLTDHRSGHCELFASSFVLLARSIGVPARMVGGYRVTEYNALTEQWTVRDRNAHAWVEAWVAGAWVTYDPTPPAGLAQHMPAETEGVDAWTDAAGVYVERLGTFIVERIVWLGPVMLMLALVFLFRRELFEWLRSSRTEVAVDEALTYGEPRAVYAKLQTNLHERGFARADHETLESFAERIAETDNTGAAEAVRAYAAARYGGLEERLQEVERYLLTVS